MKKMIPKIDGRGRRHGSTDVLERLSEEELDRRMSDPPDNVAFAMSLPILPSEYDRSDPL